MTVSNELLYLIGCMFAFGVGFLFGYAASVQVKPKKKLADCIPKNRNPPPVHQIAKKERRDKFDQDSKSTPEKYIDTYNNIHGPGAYQKDHTEENSMDVISADPLAQIPDTSYLNDIIRIQMTVEYYHSDMFWKLDRNILTSLKYKIVSEELKFNGSPHVEVHIKTFRTRFIEQVSEGAYRPLYMLKRTGDGSLSQPTSIKFERVG